jgi:dephospho-CoA kinase
VEGAVILEAGLKHKYDEIWVTQCSREVALKRVKERNPHLTEEDILDRMESQMTDVERLDHAAFSYNTTEDLFETNAVKIDKMIEELVSRNVFKSRMLA